MSNGKSSRSDGDAIMIERRTEAQREGQPRPRHRHPPAIGNRSSELEAVVAGDCRDPFGFLGMHLDGPGNCVTVRVFYPGATKLEILHASGAVSERERVDPAGFWAAALTDQGERFSYRLRATTP